MAPKSAYDLLHPSIQRWVWQQGWTDLRIIQQNAIPEVINADRDVIIGAPTAGGKTEAAYLPILSNLLNNPVEKGYSVLNISPLKALINDQYGRMLSLTSDLGINVTRWHGDVAGSTKRTSLNNPSGILIITPESLESLFVNRPHALETAFRNLRYIVVDELHAFMEGERGMQLQSLLARLEAAVGRQIPRIALSATFADYSQAISFLRPGRFNYPVAVPSAGNEGHDTRILIKEFISQNTEEEFDDFVSQDIYRNLRGTNNLVFANSRKEAEAMALKMRDMCDEKGVPNEFMLHHGSLSKQEREGVEKSLKEGVHPTTAICTSTLELGVDIGKVKSIAQLVTANSVSGLRQRLGRSGRRGEPSILRIYSLDEQRDDYKYHLRTSLVQNIAVIELLSRNQFERHNPDIPHYSTLIQQILSVTAQYGSFYAAEAWKLLCRDGAFRNISAAEFQDVLRALGSKDLISQTSTGQIVIGKAGEREVKNLDFYTAFVTMKDFNVMDKSTGHVVGSVQYKPYVGEYILLSARRWLVDSIDERTGLISVHPAHTTGKMMFEGFGQEIDGLITRKMKEIYESDQQYAYLDKRTGAPEELRLAREYYRDMKLGENPAITIGGTNLLFTWGGMKVNRTLALMQKSQGYSMPHYDGYAVADVSPDILQKAISIPPDLVKLAAQVPRYRKEDDKYDHLLPDNLLDRKYAASALAIPSQGTKV